MRTRVLAALLVALLAFAVAGCGGDDEGGAAGGGDTGGAATIAPASAAGFISINADLESDQWKQAKELSQKFPGRQQLLDMIEKELADEGVDYARDVDPAIGPEVAFVFLEGSTDPIGLTQPDDKEKLDALLAKSDEQLVTEGIEGWTAIAETQSALDAFKRARESGPLADDGTFKEAMGELPDEALATGYGNGKALRSALAQIGGTSSLTGGGELVYIAAALEAVENGVKLAGLTESEGTRGGEPYEPTLLERIPSGAIAALSFNNAQQNISQLGSNPVVQQFLPEIERALGVTLTELGALFSGESAVYVRQGSPIPEITALLEADDPNAAVATLDKLATRVSGLVGGRPGSATVDGVRTKYLEVQGVRISYGTFDGMVVVTTGASAIRDLRSSDSKLGDDETFKRSSEAAGLEEKTSGFLYVNLREAITLIQGFAGLAGEDIPSEVSANLEPLDTLLVHATKDGDRFRFTGYVGLK
jgi:hypothetical protein